MKIQVDLPEDLNKELKVYKAERDLVTLQEALVEALYKFFKQKK